MLIASIIIALFSVPRRLTALLSHQIMNDDDVGLHDLGCRVDILGTNCKKLLKVKMSVQGGGGGRGSLWFQYV